MVTHSHLTRRAFAVGTALFGLTANALPAMAADFPTKPIRIIVPWPAGGGGDVVVRLMAPALSERLNTPVVVENRPGATGTIGSTIAAKSPADGYTLVYGTADSNSIMPHLLKGVSYDRRSFVAVAPIGYFPYALAVHPSVNASNLKEFVQLARVSVAPLSYASWGIGSSGHVLGESLKAATGIDMLHVPFQGTAPVLNALISGQVKAAILPMPLVEQYVKSGSIKLLGVAASERLPGLNELPTLKEQGANVDLTTWVGFLAPEKVPADVVARLHKAINEVEARPDVSARLRQLQVISQPMSQPDYQTFVDSEYERWGKVVRQSRITLE
ncbi:tripartite tricarboxylate transporter substrate binding protein [Acidovorax sp. D2M1]|uniref:Tripartite tricarboxylate transporter substrate binding protein n=1 Tax=Acidovorax benzenivorans TaxID=2987520 RepID=A0ABT5S3K6_9BURK|nr:tripartite tricarboxylate transporter substrate binding protein [Acidovorax benzenivorans]MDD2180540.1 tripartite tricarboxylate transporter substrate binding protein [Acidovorax benzenivorans]